MHSPTADEEYAHHPREGPRFIGDIGHDLLLAGGTGRHARRRPQCRVIANKLPFAIVQACADATSSTGVHCRGQRGDEAEQMAQTKQNNFNYVHKSEAVFIISTSNICYGLPVLGSLS